MKKKRKYVDSEAVRKSVSILDVLNEHYGVAGSLITIADGRAHSGACPICSSELGNPFRITIDDDSNKWLCLAECNSGGDVLDLVARIEGTDIHGAAVMMAKWFGPESPTTRGDPKKASGEAKGYLQNLEAQLHRLLSLGDYDATIKYVKEKCLESYRNGREVSQTRR